MISTNLPKLVGDIIYYYIERENRRKLHEEFGRRIILDDMYSVSDCIFFMHRNDYVMFTMIIDECEYGGHYVRNRRISTMFRETSPNARIPEKYFYSSGSNNPSGYKKKRIQTLIDFFSE